MSEYVLEDFPTNETTNWKGITTSSSIKHSGSFSGYWQNTSRPNTISLNLSMINKTDWTDYSMFSIWLYNERIDDTQYRIYATSENTSTSGED